MAAPQIPNLNLLRRGRGRGRGGSRTVEDGHSNRPSGKDRIVQGTDSDASVSRLSAVELGYLVDPYATALTPPGTYVRTTAIDELVTRFLGPYSPETSSKKQIISLGAGSDTRVFRIFSSRPSSDLVYHELDFAVNTGAKIRAIRSTPHLQKALGIDPSSKEISVSETGDALHTPSYHIHPLDLRSLSSDSSPAAILPGVDTSLPTLLISECCLVYLSPTEAAQVVTFFTEHVFSQTPSSSPGQTGHAIPPLGLVLYEPIRPDDPFGRTMVSNLAARGIQLQTLNKFSSLEAQRARLHSHGFRSGQAAADIDFIWERWVNEEEKERVASLEFLDEMEEWQLLARHYCIAWGWRDRDDASIFNSWKTLQAQPGP
ncbi:hypothetical protein N7462_005760 [Penicillium macrosclerotiorum]|uniref:uncharacterized protein n=1 Tax=Penicillium macrosclerotiorum TaxID=303699 RepID=UPI002546F6B2|nr:uncharacterized protein N7462_005760 [Penicillium macrosclerotiorum]KAJ5682595.1 hypothetical protein N7462_005760 [Penicillium macrosclerotiorum]